MKTASRTALLSGACSALVLLSLYLGRFHITAIDLFHQFLPAMSGMDGARQHIVRSVLLTSRLPRILAAILVGAALSSAGATYQAVFRNPLVSPGLLGVLAGAGFGAALGIVTGTGAAVIQALSFLGGVTAVLLATLVQRTFGAGTILMLVFGGLVSTALFTAFLSILKFVADPESQLPDIVFWLLGSLNQVSWLQLGVAFCPVLLGIGVLTRYGRLLDALSMGDDEARSLGVPVDMVRYSAIAIATALSALTVSMAGMIGWVGLVIPHIARFLGGPANSRLIPLSAVIGGMFMLLSDDIARTLSAEELPVGIITDLFGCLAFLGVLRLVRPQTT